LFHDLENKKSQDTIKKDKMKATTAEDRLVTEEQEE